MDGGVPAFAASTLVGRRLPATRLPATDGARVDCSRLDGLTVIICHPDLSRGPRAAPDDFPRGAEPWSCDIQAAAFRDWYVRLRHAGVDRVTAISLRTPEWQRERRNRLELPFHLLSDADLTLTTALRLPVVRAGDAIGLTRATLIVRDGEIQDVTDPGANPARDAATVFRIVSTRSAI